VVSKEQRTVRKMRGTNIHDVSRVAKVSSTSISNYLNGRMGEMRPETQQRIAKAIKQLGYTPNSAARQLKTGHAPILGLLVPSVVNPYFGELAVAVDAAAQRRGYRVVLCNTQREPERELSFVRELAAYGVRGILAASVLQNVEAMSSLIARGVAFVLFEIPGADPGIAQVDVVAMNNVMAAEKAVDHLVALGHTAIAFATATPLTPHRVSRLQGYRNALRRHGLGEGVVITDEDIPSHSAAHNDADLARFGHVAAGHILTMRPRPSAVIAMNDLVALGMMSAFHEQGVRIPDEISMVGIDDIQLSAFSFPALTTVRQPYLQIAESAIERLCARMADPARASATLALDPALIVRASTAARCAR
jgi:DNA-binding LacI/PurR family transcriptional regulator